MRAWTGSLALVLALVGCESRVLGAFPAPGTAPLPEGVATLALRPASPATWALQALITENRRRIHHVNMRLFRRAADGAWPATPEAARLDLPASAVGQPLKLGFLKFGSTYRLLVEAYADAQENLTTLLSDGAASRLEFTTPGPQLVGGALSVVTTVPISVPLVLLNTAYSGQAGYTLTVFNGQVTHVKLDLTTPAGLVASATYPRGSLPSSGTIANLKLGNTYTLAATGMRGTGLQGLDQVVASATVTFTTPGVSASGTVDTGPFGPWGLVLN
jgi:hypothetical protein